MRRGEQVVQDECTEVVAAGYPAERPQPAGLRLAHAFQQLARLARIAEVLVAFNLAEPLEESVVDARCEHVVVVACDPVRDEHKLLGRVVLELQRLCEPGGETGVGVQEVRHLMGVPGCNDRSLVAVVLHQLHERVDGLLAEVGAGAGGPGQGVSLVDEQHTAHDLLKNRGGLLGGVTDVLADELAPRHLLELAVG